MDAAASVLGRAFDHDRDGILIQMILVHGVRRCSRGLGHGLAARAGRGVASAGRRHIAENRRGALADWRRARPVPSALCAVGADALASARQPVRGALAAAGRRHDGVGAAAGARRKLDAMMGAEAMASARGGRGAAGYRLGLKTATCACMRSVCCGEKVFMQSSSV
ncbi:MAG: hypothetical protein Tsb0020_32840 [Haliangiales bacterium]